MPTQINLLKPEYLNKYPHLQPRYKRSSKYRKFLLPLLAIVPFLAITSYLLIPKSEPTNPLDNNNQPEIVRQSLTIEKKPISYYLANSEEYLDEARTTSKRLGKNQTQQDKKKIVSLLNESLKMATNAIKHYPELPEGYQQRAKIYQTISHLDPSASPKAERDLEIAIQLAGGNLKDLDINPADIVNAAPIEEASLLKNVAIAFPDEDKIQEVDGTEDSNAKKGTTTIPAGNTSVTVNSDYVTNDNLIYFTPQGDTMNEIISLKSKSEKDHSFKLSLSSPLPHDLEVEWWIVE